jgi:hypothetical protein
LLAPLHTPYAKQVVWRPSQLATQLLASSLVLSLPPQPPQLFLLAMLRKEPAMLLALQLRLHRRLEARGQVGEGDDSLVEGAVRSKL